MNPFDLLKNQLGNLPEILKQHQETLNKLEVMGEAGASGVGTVKVKVTGRFQAKEMWIDADAWKEGSAFVAELSCAAFNDAIAKIMDKNQGPMANMMNAMSLKK